MLLGASELKLGPPSGKRGGRLLRLIAIVGKSLEDSPVDELLRAVKV
jgi:hypothetical protein